MPTSILVDLAYDIRLMRKAEFERPIRLAALDLERCRALPAGLQDALQQDPDDPLFLSLALADKDEEPLDADEAEALEEARHELAVGQAVGHGG